MNWCTWMYQCWPTSKDLHKVIADTRWNIEYLPGAMDDRDGWRVRVREMRTVSATWWYIYIYILYIYIYNIYIYIYIKILCYAFKNRLYIYIYIVMFVPWIIFFEILPNSVLEGLINLVYNFIYKIWLMVLFLRVFSSHQKRKTGWK